MQKQTGFLLSYLKYGENDAVLHCFTLENGYQSFFLRGLYSAKNKKKAYLIPLHELNFTLSSHSANSTLPAISKIEKKENQEDFWDVKQSSVVFFVADFLHQTLKNEESNLKLYAEIKAFKSSLSSGNLYAHYLFLMRILKIFGIAPLLSENQYLEIERGIFTNETSAQTLDMSLSTIWKNILTNDQLEIKIEKEHRKKLMDSILLFYKLHFPEFYIPKSLQIIHQLFE